MEGQISQNVTYSNIYRNYQEFAPAFFCSQTQGDRPEFSSFNIEATGNVNKV